MVVNWFPVTFVPPMFVKSSPDLYSIILYFFALVNVPEVTSVPKLKEESSEVTPVAVPNAKVKPLQIAES